MQKTKNLELPIYDNPDLDVFDLQDWNLANQNIDIAYEEMANFKQDLAKVDANSEIVEARKGKETLGEKIDELDKKMPYVSFKSFGANGNGTFDNKDIFITAIQYCISNNIKQLMIEKGIYYTSVGFETKGITLIGQGYEVPFLTWDYTRDNGTDDYNKYKTKCNGSVITSDKDISIITDGLKAKDIGFFGNRRMANQHCVSGNGGDCFLELSNVGMIGFGSSAVYFPQGVINPVIENRCRIIQNYKGIEFGNENGSYTGETNRITIKDSSFNRNEKNGICGKVKGRHIIIKNNTFEAVGEPSDTERPKPTSVDNINYAIDLELYNSGAWTNGSINLEDNYLEETYGFAKIIAKSPINTIIIRNNEWYAYDQINYSNFLCFDGYINNLNIEPNNVYTSKDYVYFKSFNVRNFKSDLPITNAKANIHTKIENEKTVLDLNIDGDSYVKYNVTKYEDVNIFLDGFVTGLQYDGSFTSDEYFPSGQGATYVKVDKTKANGFNFATDGIGSAYSRSGFALVVNNKVLGIINGWSNLNSHFIIRGNRTGFDIGNGVAKMVRLSGFSYLNGNGEVIKPVFDWDNKLIPYGK